MVKHTRDLQCLRRNSWDRSYLFLTSVTNLPYLRMEGKSALKIGEKIAKSVLTRQTHEFQKLCGTSVLKTYYGHKNDL